MAVEGHCFFLCLPLDLANICEKTGSRLMHVPVSRQAEPGAKNLTPGQKRENIYRKRRRSPAWMQWATS